MLETQDRIDAFRDGGDTVDLHALPDVYQMIGQADFPMIG